MASAGDRVNWRKAAIGPAQAPAVGTRVSDRRNTRFGFFFILMIGVPKQKKKMKGVGERKKERKGESEKKKKKESTPHGDKVQIHNHTRHK